MSYHANLNLIFIGPRRFERLGSPLIALTLRPVDVILPTVVTGDGLSLVLISTGRRRIDETDMTDTDLTSVTAVDGIRVRVPSTLADLRGH